MRDMLRSSLNHTPDRRVDRVATTPLRQQGMDKHMRQQTYDRILRMVADSSLLPLTHEEATDYLNSISALPLIPNTLFPPDETILARSIKTTMQYALIHPSSLCTGRGLWLKPDIEIPKGTFIGIYAGWVTDRSATAIWDMEDMDQSYALGLIGFQYKETSGGEEVLQQAVVHAHDRLLPSSDGCFPLACTNEWIWETTSTYSDQNTLRFGRMGMVFSNRHVMRSSTKVELTIGLGREGTPFTGWTSYKKQLMVRLLDILQMVLLDSQSLEVNLTLQWRCLIEELRDTIELVRYNSLTLLREDRSALAILLAGVENESELDPSITMVYNVWESMLDNLRRITQHVEIRKRCNFRHADRPMFPSTSSTGSITFWTKILTSEAKRIRPEVPGTRRSARITPKAFSETNVVVVIDSAGQRKRISTLPLALIPDDAGPSDRIEANSLHIFKGQECVAMPCDNDKKAHCSVRFEDGRVTLARISDLTQPAAGDFLNASWTIEERSTQIAVRKQPKLGNFPTAPMLYGQDYKIVEEQLEAEGLLIGKENYMLLANDHGTCLRNPPSSVLRISTWNASGLKSMRKLKLVIALMSTAALDILCIQDTRIEPGLWAEEIVKTAKEDLGPGASVFLATVAARPSGSQGPNVGGQLIFKSARVGMASNFWVDSSTLGVVCSFDVHMGGADLRFVSLYVPPDRGAVSAAQPSALDQNEPISSLDTDFVFRGGLTSRLQLFTDIHQQGVSPAEYILSTVQTRMQSHLNTPGSAVICMGDFNANGTRKQPQSINGHICDWTQMLGLLNATAILSPQGECPNTFYRQGCGISDIDHILFARDRGLLPIGWKVLDSSMWLTLSNHCPLVLDFEVPNFTEVYCSRRKRRRRARRRFLDISRNVGSEDQGYRQRDIEMYQKYLTRLHQTPAADPQTRFGDIMKVTRSALLSVSRRRRASSIWSPEIVALTANQIAVTEMGRYLDGLKGRKQWKQCSHIKHGMAIILENWERQMRKLTLSDKDSKEVDFSRWLNFSNRGPDFWRSISWERDELLAQVICEKRRLSRLLAKRQQMEWQECIRDKADRRMRARLQGKHLRELRSLLGTGHTPYSLEFLIAEGKCLVDQKTIHTKVTNHFSDWFKKSDCSWGFHNKDNDFKRLWNDKEFFFHSHVDSEIPHHLLDIIWKAMRPRQHESEEDRESFDTFLKAAPTLEEFKEAIRLSPIHSAGGPTEVTYNAVAAWDESLTLEVYTILHSMWADRTIPACWKWRWLVPIPKVQDNVTLDDLRPLMLTDVTRKLWIGIVVNKIQSYWRTHGLLSDSQHGFLENKSTEGALLQFRNVLEEARESCTDVFLSSWDIRRAFDRVPKQLLILGWMRLGVPQSIAEYLVSIDIDGLTMVRTPIAQQVWDRWGSQGFSDISTGSMDTLASFQTETGTGQGNIDSPLNWTSIMDILLRALEDADLHPFFIRTNTNHGCGLGIAPDIAYADDLISLTSRLEGLQHKADVVCAFCLIFGLDIAVPKLRAYKVHWGGEHTESIGLTEGEDGKSLSHFVSIHLKGWTCRRVRVNSFDTAPPLKYLGVLFDLTNLDTSAKTWAMSTARSLVARLFDRSIDRELKLDAITQVVYPKLLYSAQFSSWSLKEYVAMDTIFSSFFRQFLGLRKSFPAELLYAPESVCGIGLPRFSNEAHSRKLAVLFRGFQSDSATKLAVTSLLLRGLRLQNKRPAFTQFAQMTPQHIPQPLFVRSIVEWLAIANLCLAKGGQVFLSHSFTSLIDFFDNQGIHLSDEQVSILSAHGISMVGDIVTSGSAFDVSLRRGRSKSCEEETMKAHVFLGRRIRKDFPPHGSFEGTVHSYLFPWFRILYDDGDSEEISLKELQLLLIDEPSTRQTLRWLSFHDTALQFLDDILPPLPPDLTSILVMRDQCFMSDNRHFPMDQGWIWELLGFKGELACIRTWRFKQHCRPLRGDHVTLDSMSLGAATAVWVPTEDIFGNQEEAISLFRVLLGPDINKRKIHRLVFSIFRQPPPDFNTPDMEVPFLRRLFEEIPYIDDTQCFTDGSLFQDPNPLVEAFISPSQTYPYRQLGTSPTSSGALVARKIGSEAHEPSEMMIRVTDGEEVHCGDAYDIELILLTLGCVLRWMAAVFTSPNVIIDLYSDCRSAIDKANLTDLHAIRHLGHKEHGLLLRLIYESRYSADLKVTHVYGHPERRLGRDDSWQSLKGEDAGIYIADKVAGRDFTHMECKRPLIDISAQEVLKALGCLQECLIVRTNGTPILEDPLVLVQHVQFQTYLDNRDKTRATRRWTSYIRDAPKTAHPCGKLFSSRAKRTKLVFNWYIREEHLFRDLPTISCPLCCDNMHGDTEKHIYLYCRNVEIENVRLETIDTLRNLALGDGTYSPTLSWCLAGILRLLLEHEDRHLAWKGVIPLEYWQTLLASLPEYKTTERRQIVEKIREIFGITGGAVKDMRKAYWISRSAPPAPVLTLSPLTSWQSSYISQRKQTRLPTLWGIMTTAEQIDWEIRRRLRKPPKQPPLPPKRTQSTRRLPTPPIIPTQVMFRKLFGIRTE